MGALTLHIRRLIMAATNKTLDPLLQSHLDAFRTAVPSQDHAVHDSFETIFFSNDRDRADCESAWKNFVKYICSIPDNNKYTRMGDSSLLTDTYPP